MFINKISYQNRNLSNKTTISTSKAMQISFLNLLSSLSQEIGKNSNTIIQAKTTCNKLIFPDRS